MIDNNQRTLEETIALINKEIESSITQFRVNAEELNILFKAHGKNFTDFMNVLEKKLYEISATNFGRRVFEYYLDLKISYDFRKKHTNQDSVAEVLLKEAIYLPRKVVVKSTDTTARMLKKSVEQVKSIRNFFD